MNCSIRSLAHDGMASFEYQGHSQLVGCGILRWPTSFQMASLSLSLSLFLSFSIIRAWPHGCCFGVPGRSFCGSFRPKRGHALAKLEQGKDSLVDQHGSILADHTPTTLNKPHTIKIFKVDPSLQFDHSKHRNDLEL